MITLPARTIKINGSIPVSGGEAGRSEKEYPPPPWGVRSPFLRFLEGERKYILFIVSALRNFQIHRSRYRASLHASISPTESTLH
jgi:hypothetical protein